MGIKAIWTLLLVGVIGGTTPAQNLDATAEQRAKLVEIEKISVKGTRLPSLSVVRLIGIEAGNQVNDVSVNAACHRLQSTGLVKKVGYQYLMFPDKPGVELELTVVDETGLIPASIEPKENSVPLWTALKSPDPLFGETLPPNERAIAFYVNNFDSCLKKMGRTEEYVAPKLQASAGGTPTSIVFQVRRYRNR